MTATPAYPIIIVQQAAAQIVNTLQTDSLHIFTPAGTRWNDYAASCCAIAG